MIEYALLLAWLPAFFRDRRLSIISSLILAFLSIFFYIYSIIGEIELFLLLSLALVFPIESFNQRYRAGIFLASTLFIISSNLIIRFLGWEIGIIMLFFMLRKDNLEAATEFILFTQISAMFLLQFLISSNFIYLVSFLVIDQGLFPLQFWIRDVFSRSSWEFILLFSVVSKIPAFLIVFSSYYISLYLMFSAVLSLLFSFKFLHENKEFIALLSTASASFLDFIFLVNNGIGYLAIFSIITLFYSLTSAIMRKENQIEIPSLLYLGTPLSPVFFLILFTTLSIISQPTIMIAFSLYLFLDALVISNLIIYGRRKMLGNRNSTILSLVSMVIAITFLAINSL